ncbi:hypothetical protein D3C84_1283400 [compost metagenome]
MEAWETVMNDKQNRASNQRIETISLKGVATILFIEGFLTDGRLNERRDRFRPHGVGLDPSVCEIAF